MPTGGAQHDHVNDIYACLCVDFEDPSLEICGQYNPHHLNIFMIYIGQTCLKVFQKNISELNIDILVGF